jgi:sulfite reductase (NADPH) hemoprotein beta-component
VIGPSFSADEMPIVIKKIIDAYVKEKYADESFIDCVTRTGLDPFKLSVYGEKKK